MPSRRYDVGAETYMDIIMFKAILGHKFKIKDNEFTTIPFYNGKAFPYCGSFPTKSIDISETKPGTPVFANIYKNENKYIVSAIAHRDFIRDWDIFIPYKCVVTEYVQAKHIYVARIDEPSLNEHEFGRPIYISESILNDKLEIGKHIFLYIYASNDKYGKEYLWAAHVNYID